VFVIFCGFLFECRRCVVFLWFCFSVVCFCGVLWDVFLFVWFFSGVYVVLGRFFCGLGVCFLVYLCFLFL